MRRSPETGFLFVGDGPNRKRLKERAVSLAIQDYVIFTGFTHDIPTILANTDISVLMTNAQVITEGISNSLLESMAMGVPVVASRGGGTEEVVDHGVNGFLVDPYDHRYP